MAPRRSSTGWVTSKTLRTFAGFLVVVALAAGLGAPWGTGYVLATGFAAGDRVVVDTDYLNLRTGPELSRTVIDVLAGGAALTVTAGPRSADGYGWYEVQTDDGTTGWVAGEFLALASSWSRFAAGDLAVVDTAHLNCRSGPGLDFGVIYVMVGGTEVDILAGPTAADGYHWYKVRTDDGNVGWVVGEALVPWSEPTGHYAKGSDVVVDTDRLNLRAGAGLSKTVVDVLPGGTPLLVSNGPMAADGHDWYEVETRDGRLGWVAGDYLAAASGLDFAVGDAVRVTGGRLNLREAPGLDADVRRVMADNEVLLVRGGPVEADGYTWYRVWNDAGEGWAAGEFLRFDPNGFPPEAGD